MPAGITVANESLDVPATTDLHVIPPPVLLKILIDILFPTATTAAWTGPVDLHGPLATDVDEGATLTISGVISGPEGLTKEGLGKLVLAGANTFAGLTQVEQGVLQVGNNTALGSSDGATEVVAG